MKIVGYFLFERRIVNFYSIDRYTDGFIERKKVGWIVRKCLSCEKKHGIFESRQMNFECPESHWGGTISYIL